MHECTQAFTHARMHARASARAHMHATSDSSCSRRVARCTTDTVPVPMQPQQHPPVFTLINGLMEATSHA
eukprot:1169059-Lingulodinium_polyedra.AAC.1